MKVDSFPYSSVKWLLIKTKKNITLPKFDAVVRIRNTTLNANEDPDFKYNVATSKISTFSCIEKQLKVRKYEEISFLVSSIEIERNGGNNLITTKGDCYILLVNGRLINKKSDTNIQFQEIFKVSCEILNSNLDSQFEQFGEEDQQFNKYVISQRNKHESASIQNQLKPIHNQVTISVYKIESQNNANAIFNIINRDSSSMIPSKITNSSKRFIKVFTIVPSIWMEQIFKKSYDDIKTVSHLEELTQFIEKDIYHLMKLFPDRKSICTNSFIDLLQELHQKQNSLIENCDIYKDVINTYNYAFSILQSDSFNEELTIDSNKENSETIDDRNETSLSIQPTDKSMDYNKENKDKSEILNSMLQEFSRMLLRLEHRFIDFAYQQEQKTIPENKEKNQKNILYSIDNIKNLKERGFIAEYLTLIYQHIQLLKQFQSLLQIVYNNYCPIFIDSQKKMDKVFSAWSKCQENRISQERMLHYILASIQDTEIQISKLYSDIEVRIETLSILKEESLVDSLRNLDSNVLKIQHLSKFFFSQCVAAKNFLNLVVFHVNGNHLTSLKDLVVCANSQMKSFNQLGKNGRVYYRCSLGNEIQSTNNQQKVENDSSYIGFSFMYTIFKISLFIATKTIESTHPPIYKKKNRHNNKKRLYSNELFNSFQIKFKGDNRRWSDSIIFQFNNYIKLPSSIPRSKSNGDIHNINLDLNNSLNSSTIFQSSHNSKLNDLKNLNRFSHKESNENSISSVSSLYLSTSSNENSEDQNEATSNHEDDFNSRIIVRSFHDIEHIRLILPMYSALSTSERKILPYLAQSVHNFLEYIHFLMYNICSNELSNSNKIQNNSKEPKYIKLVVHNSGQQLLWNIQEMRDIYKNISLNTFWSHLKKCLFSIEELEKYESIALSSSSLNSSIQAQDIAISENLSHKYKRSPQNNSIPIQSKDQNSKKKISTKILLRKICCSTKNKPIQQIVIEQIIPLLLCVFRNGFQTSEQSSTERNLFWFKKHSNQKNEVICNLWKNVGLTCSWVNEMLKTMNYYKIIEQSDISNMSLYEDNQITSEVLLYALNDQGLSNLIVEFARNRSNMTYYSDNSIFRNREKLQILVDLLSIVDEYPLKCIHSFLYTDN